MRSALLSLIALGALAQPVVLPSSPCPAPEEVLQFLLGMNLAPEFRAAVAGALSAGMATGRATPTVSLLLLQDLARLPREAAERILEVIRFALAQGFIVDTGLAGSSMMNEARKLLALGRKPEEIEAVLRMRLAVLLATRSVLSRSGVVAASPAPPDKPLPPEERFVLEVAWAVGDFVLWEGGSFADPRLFPFVQGRLNRLCSVGVLSAEQCQRSVVALTPEMLQEIGRLAFQPERR
ncbi:MAG: hypothetical protein ABDI20_04365 [Candidatus Bipolaricaulaceae bacterium]